MEVKFFYNTNPFSLSDEINDWLEWFETEQGTMKIFDIKQTSMSPDRLFFNTDNFSYDQRVDTESYLVVSIWYEAYRKSR